MSESLTTLLNKCEAIFACKFSSIGKCAAAIKERPQRVSEWVTQRAYDPSGAAAMKLHDWCAHKSLQISMSSGAIQTGYRRAYRSVCERREKK